MVFICVLCGDKEPYYCACKGEICGGSIGIEYLCDTSQIFACCTQQTYACYARDISFDV